MEMGKYFDLIIRKVTWKKAIIFSLPFVFLFALINFSGVGVAGLLKITGGANILDAEFGYTQEEALEKLTELGERGREFYLNRIVPIDFPFPFSFMLFFTVWISLLLKQIKLENLWKYTLFLPPLAMLSDWIENIGEIVMLKNYPDLPSWASFIGSISGILKIILVLMNLMTILILIIVFVIRKKLEKEPYGT